MEEEPSRQLAVLLHADVVGSTALVQLHETLAHQRIQGAFRRFSEIILSHGGTAREIRGDALVAEFSKASDAVSAAVAFQTANAAHNEGLGDDVLPVIRVGIAMGEVVFADNTVTGEGVVLAQRLEQLAEPGGVSIQGAAYETVPKRLPFEYESLGEQEVKGFQEPVRVYRVVLETSTPISSLDLGRDKKETRLVWRGFAVAVVVLFVLVGVGLGWWQPWKSEFEPASPDRMALPLPDKPSIAVLPFTNMSGDPEQEYFVDGMTEDLITDLSKLSGLFVISRNSSFTYKGKSVKAPQIAEELGIRYVLEGSVRRVGSQVRINAQLIDATADGHLWAERYDGSVENVFALQDDVTERIVAALAVELTGEEVAKRAHRETSDTLAYDAFLQGWSYYKLGTRPDFIKAKPFLEEAVRLDPSYARAHAALASVYWDAFTNGWTFELGVLSFEVETLWEEHLELAKKGPNSLVHTVQSRVLASQERYKEAVVEAEKAVALDGDEAAANAGLAHALILAGRPEEGADLIHKAMRLDPHYPADYLTTLGAAQFGLENYAEAVTTFNRAIKRNPDSELPHIYLAAIYGHLGRLDEAEAMVEATNYIRYKGPKSGALSLERKVDDSWSPFQGEIDFRVFGQKPLQERVRTGLSGIPLLKWHYLITIHKQSEYPFRRAEVEGATQIDLATAKTFHERGVIFIDASDAAQWKQGHIPGAIHLPFYWDETDPTRPRFQQTTLSETVDITEEVVFYRCGQTWCAGAWQAAKAVAWGYQKVYWFRTGPLQWKEGEFPVEQSE